MKNNMKKLIFILFFFISLIFPQNETFSFTAEEIQSLYGQIKELQYKDSLNTKIIENLNSQIYDYKRVIKNDSLIITYQKLELELKDKLIKEVRPKWYENKYIYWLYGAGTVIVSSWAVSNVK